MMQKTYMLKEKDIKPSCYLIDASGKVLGKVAAKAAEILRGKHKPTYTPHVACGDMVVIINAEKVRVTGKKMEQKEYQRYSGFHGGQKVLKLKELLAKSPEQVLRLAVNRMIPSGPLGNKIRRRLKVYAGAEHPHQAQKPILLEI